MSDPQDLLIQQLPAQVQVLEAAAVAAAAPPGGAPAAPVFTLAPALANTAAYLYLTSTEWEKTFQRRH